MNPVLLQVYTKCIKKGGKIKGWIPWIFSLEVHRSPDASWIITNNLIMKWRVRNVREMIPRWVKGREEEREGWNRKEKIGRMDGQVWICDQCNCWNSCEESYELSGSRMPEASELEKKKKRWDREGRRTQRILLSGSDAISSSSSTTIYSNFCKNGRRQQME